MFVVQVNVFENVSGIVFCFNVKPNHLNQVFYTLFLVVSHPKTTSLLKHSTKYKQCFMTTLVNISDSLLFSMCSEALCKASLALKSTYIIIY